MRSEISIVLNGEQRVLAGGRTVLDLLQELELDPRIIVVEVNREIVRRPTLGTKDLREGDCVELVHFVGGG